MSTSIGSTEIDVWIACQHCWNTRNFKSRISWKRMDTGTCFPQMMQMYISVVLCVEVARKSFQSVRLHENIKIAWQDTNRYHRLVVFFLPAFTSHFLHMKAKLATLLKWTCCKLSIIHQVHPIPTVSLRPAMELVKSIRSYQQIFITTTPL